MPTNTHEADLEALIVKWLPDETKSGDEDILEEAK